MSKESREYALAKLIEELGELLQVLGKLRAFPHGHHPDGGPQLMLRFAEESGDVYAALRYFREEYGLALRGEYDSPTDLWTRIQRKLKLFRAWGKARTSQGHQLWVSEDKDVPNSILDRNGEVVLGLCRICGKGEVELSEPCDPRPTFDHQTGPTATLENHHEN